MAQMIELEQMLEARERRVARQRELLDQYHRTLICFTMNIAGPVKNSPLIRRGFAVGNTLLRRQLERAQAPCLFSEQLDEPTGCEGFYVVDFDAQEVKKLTCELEENADLGRVFDMDVLTPDGMKLDRPTPRRCLLCGGPAKACARSRTHTVEQLQAKTTELLQACLRRRDVETAAGLACRALLYEVCTTPKPGLVDRANNGSHKDMDIFTFMRSSAALWPYFAECTKIGWDTAAQPPKKTFAALRWRGKMAEDAMLAATAGVNTHKGAIFSVGLICAALGRLEREEWTAPERILTEVASMTEGLTEREFTALTPETAQTAGQRFFVQYHVTGVRGQAEAGFPTVLQYGLPVLEDGLKRGKSFDEAGAAAMLALLAHTTDTNMIARGGLSAQRDMAAQIARVLEDTPYPDKKTLDRLDQVFVEKNLSPGGSADLMALCWLLHFLREEEF